MLAPPMAFGTQFRLAYAGPDTMTARIMMERLERTGRLVIARDIEELIYESILEVS